MIHWLTQSHDVVPQTAVHGHPLHFLSDSEADRLATLPSETQRRDWLLGRWTAKRLLQTVIWETNGTTVPLDLITLRNVASGMPTIESQLPLVNGQFSLSFSQANGQVLVTAVAKPNWPIGAQIDPIQPRSQKCIDAYFTEKELALMHQIENTEQDLLVTAVCSAKTAVRKALKLEPSVDLKAISCLIDPAKRASDTWVPFKIRYDNNRLRQPAPHLSGWWRTMDQFVLTLVIKQ